MNRYLVMLLVTCLITACDNRKCLKSHTEQRESCMCISIGNNVCMPTTHNYTDDVCDKYENNNPLFEDD